MKTLSVAALALCAAPAFAAPSTFTLDFEGAPGFVNSVGEFYNGGTDNLGQSGADHGVAFTDAAVTLSNDAAGPYYSNAPSPLAVLFAFDSTAVMNVARGFVDRLSFHYSSTLPAIDAVNIYSGLDATGTLLASASLSANATSGCSGSPFCRFDLLDVDFTGLARSVSFGGNAPDVLFDNISISAIPEPSGCMLVAAGLMAAGAVKRRRRG